MACAKCGKKREIARYNEHLPKDVEFATLNYIGYGSEKTFYNPKTKLVRKAGGKINKIEVPLDELSFWLTIQRNNKRQFELAPIESSVEVVDTLEQPLEQPVEEVVESELDKAFSVENYDPEKAVLLDFPFEADEESEVEVVDITVDKAVVEFLANSSSEEELEEPKKRGRKKKSETLEE